MNIDGAHGDALDLLATMVAVVRTDGSIEFVNATFEAAAGISRRALMRGSLFDWLLDANPLRETLIAVTRNEISTGRFEGLLKRAPLAAHETVPVHVIVTQVDTSGMRALA